MTSSNDVINFSIFDDVIDDVIEVGKISKTIFEEFLSFPKFKKKFKRIGLLEKSWRGVGVKLTMKPLGKQPA